MAKVQFGGIATDARGKLAGIVYSKNAAGAYVRQKVSPTQSLTTRRGLVRSRITNLSKYWSATLTAAQIASWNAFAKNNPVTDVFGRSQTLSGIQTFCRLNAQILNVGGTQIDVPPPSLTIVGITTITVTAVAGVAALSIAYTATPLAANTVLNVFATQQLPVGRTFTKPFMRWIFSSAAAAASPANVLAAYTAKFGTLVAGSKIGVLVNVVNDDTGAATTGLYALTTVAP
jgi:hypothetical protein